MKNFLSSGSDHAVFKAERNAFVTSEGYMGLGPADSKKGNVIVVPPGAKLPFAMRADIECHEILGPCYGESAAGRGSFYMLTCGKFTA